LRNELSDPRPTRRRAWFATIVASGLVITALTTSASHAENLFDLLFGGFKKPQTQTSPQNNFFADPFGLNQQPNAAPPRPVATSSGGRGGTFCVRTCDGKYFPLSIRGGATPARMCQAFCPAAQTKIYSGSTIDSAVASNGERYADSANAFAYRKALKADCTCNGRDPAGLAQIDLTHDTSLRSGDVVATTDGLVAYTGVRLGTTQAPDFSPVASYPGLTADIRARLGEMKVAPSNAELVADSASVLESNRSAELPEAAVRATSSPQNKRTTVN